MNNDPELQLGINISGFKMTINPIAIYRQRFSKQAKAKRVGDRIIKLFIEHGIYITQIPRMLPEVHLDQLVDTEKLLTTITPEVIKKVAGLFGIKREWLEGSTKRIYKSISCYKRPLDFFAELQTLNMDGDLRSIIVLCQNNNFGDGKKLKEPFVILLKDKLVDLGDNEIYRYRIFSGLDWSHWNCRAQVIAMTRLAHAIYSVSVPVICIGKKEFAEISQGHRVPSHAVNSYRPMSGLCLEDFSLFIDESMSSRDEGELGCAIELMRYDVLENTVTKMLGRNKPVIQKVGKCSCNKHSR